MVRQRFFKAIQFVVAVANDRKDIASRVIAERFAKTIFKLGKGLSELTLLVQTHAGRNLRIPIALRSTSNKQQEDGHPNRRSNVSDHGNRLNRFGGHVYCVNLRFPEACFGRQLLP